MAARNPGPKLVKSPIGFPGYSGKNNKDWLARQAFRDSEMNTRIYKNVFENLGVKANIPINEKIGRNRIRLRCIQGSYSRGIYRFTRMARMQFLQTCREGWMKKYGYRPGLFR